MHVDSQTLGRRVAEARQRAGLTQSDLAASIGLDRSGLAKIETGDRRLTALELARLAGAVDVRIEWFIEETPPSIVSHRNVTDPGEPSPRIDIEVERRVRAVEFLTAYDQELRALLVSTYSAFAMPRNDEEAEELASEARSLLGVDKDEPLKDLEAKVLRAGVVTFVIDLGPDSADAASVSLESGAVAVINGALRVGRRRLSLAHELGHVLVSDEYTVDWRTDGSTDSGRRETSFDRFARSLLLPGAALSEAWKEYGGNDSDRLREAAIRTASHFRVDMSTLARRLLDLSIINGTQATRVRSCRTTRADIVEHNLVIGNEVSPGNLIRDYEASVLRLFKSEKISEARALDLLFGTWEPADLPALPQLPESAIWQFVS